MNSQQKLDDFAANEFRKTLTNLIVEINPGHHSLFGSYVIKTNRQHGTDLYRHNGDLIGSFGSQRSAVSYCVAEKFRRLNLAMQIKSLDAKHCILANDIACRRAVAKKSASADFRHLVETKIAPKVQQYRVVQRELEKCINLAKYLQIKGFQNETARVFSSQTH